MSAFTLYFRNTVTACQAEIENHVNRAEAEAAYVSGRRFRFVNALRETEQESVKDEVIRRIHSKALTTVLVADEGDGVIRWEVSGSLQDYLSLAEEITDSFPTVRITPLELEKKDGVLHIIFRTVTAYKQKNTEDSTVNETENMQSKENLLLEDGE